MSEQQASIDAAMLVLDDFMSSLNASDEAGVNRSFNFPHVRFTGGGDADRGGCPFHILAGTSAFCRSKIRPLCKPLTDHLSRSGSSFPPGNDELDQDLGEAYIRGRGRQENAHEVALGRRRLLSPLPSVDHPYSHPRV